jgi:hypothetical protein
MVEGMHPAFDAELNANQALRYEQKAVPSKTRISVVPVGLGIPIPTLPRGGRSKTPIRLPYRVMKYPGY